MKKIVHVVGTGTIGEPLIGLFTDFGRHLGIDEVTFHKRTPMITEKAKVNHLLERGARIAVDSDKIADFEALGHRVAYEAGAALERATVVIDCTPAGNENKKVYEKVSGPKGFLAQGSEFGFGKMFAMGINDEALVPGEDRFLQIVSCNTHNISALIRTLGSNDNGDRILTRGRFVCMRRANDVSQDSGFAPAPSVGKHDDPDFGTHHARDASALLSTIGWNPPIFSSAMKMNTQYMHAAWFDMDVSEPTTKEKVLAKLQGQPPHRGDRAAVGEPDLLLRTRSRLLRTDPVPGRDLHADDLGPRRQRDPRVLLHSPGRQLAGLVDLRRALAHGSRSEGTAGADVGAGSILLPGDLSTGRQAAGGWAEFRLRPPAFRLRLPDPAFSRHIGCTDLPATMTAWPG